MRKLKILATTIGVIATTSLLWHSQTRAEAMDHYQPAVLIKAEMIRSVIGDSLILKAFVFILVGMGVYGVAALATGAVKLSDLRGSTKRAN